MILMLGHVAELAVKCEFTKTNYSSWMTHEPDGVPAVICSPCRKRRNSRQPRIRSKYSWIGMQGIEGAAHQVRLAVGLQEGA